MRGVVLNNGSINAAIVGQSAEKIADMAGFQVPAGTQVLIGEVEIPALRSRSRYEKLSPTLALYRRRDFDDAVETAAELVALGGIGHTSVLYTDQDLRRAGCALSARA